MTERPLNGIILLDKPQGLSSNQAMGRVKYLLRPWLPQGGRRRGGVKFGFLGTLDPLATGVLAIFVGKATRLIHLYEGLEKTYRVTMELGVRTDTMDAEGAVIETRALGGLEGTAVREAILAHEGAGEQQTPAFSAIKVGGVPAYRLAREGKAVPERKRAVILRDLRVLSIDLPQAVFEVTCSSGTYMRALAEEIGLELGVGAHVKELRRLACGPLFTLEKTVTIEGLRLCMEQGDPGFLENPAEYLPDHRAFTVDDALVTQLKNGRALSLPEPIGETASAIPVKALGRDGALLAVGLCRAQPGGQAVFQPDRVLI